MSTRTNLYLVDGDSRRRASISHSMAGSNLHVEPFEDVSELIASAPRDGVLLVHDEGEVIAPLLDHMSASGDWLPIIAYSEQPSPNRIVDAVLRGAVDYLTFPLEVDVVTESVALAAQRSAAMAGSKLREAVARSRIERLTRREREVLAGVADGLSNRMIGEKLAISPRTVEIHRANMLNKMGATHTSEAIRIAIEASLIN
jgi:FixJ family two-component response regulator